jgi:hypothetical protein
MKRRDVPMDLFTVTFHTPDDGWLGSARHHDLRMDMAAVAVDAVDENAERPLILFPAGFLQARTTQTRDALADGLLGLSQAAEVGLAFGIDIVSDDEEWAPLKEPRQCFAFACDSGERKLWSVEQQGPNAPRRPRAGRAREVTLCGWRAAVMMAAELFNHRLRDQIAAVRPELFILLTHRGANERWKPVLDKLNAQAPVILSGSAPEGQLPLWAQRTTGWIVEPVVDTRCLSVHRHRRVEIDPHYVQDDAMAAAGW